jgi:uncharacterized membrane protein YjgN (DUF898 family)
LTRDDGADFPLQSNLNPSESYPMFTILGSDGKEYGPATAEQIREWLAARRATLDTQARRADSAEWHRLGDFPEFAPLPGAATPPPPPAGEPAAQAPLTPQRFVFTGEWTEYFKIWIVNVLLTIVTLGIYAAWAKVRKRRYFHANTSLMGHSFEYLADPVRILYGNLIVGGAFLLYSLSGAISPFIQLPLALVLAVLVPWFIVRAYAFNARNTAWRGLRFQFAGTYGEAAKVFLLWPLLTLPTLGLIIPFVFRKQKEFVVTRHGYGTTRFEFTGRTEDFYKFYGIAALFFLPLIACYVTIFAVMIAAGLKRGQPPPPALGAVGLLFFLALPLAIVGGFYLRSRLFNYVWNHTSLAGHRFVADMRGVDLFVLHLVNSLVTFFTLGLLHPWAAVRTVRYELGCLQFVPAGSMDAFVAGAQPPPSAIGDVATDFFNIDLGFGV